VTGETTARTRTEEPVDVRAGLSLLVHLSSVASAKERSCSQVAEQVRDVWHLRVLRPFRRSHLTELLLTAPRFCHD
jgi:hypothetical protein